MSTLLAISHLQVDHMNASATSYALGVPLTGMAGFVHGLGCDMADAMDGNEPAMAARLRNCPFALVIESWHRPQGHAKYVVSKRHWPNKSQIQASTIDSLTAHATCSLYLDLGDLPPDACDRLQEEMIDTGILAGRILHRRFCGGTTRLSAPAVGVPARAAASSTRQDADEEHRPSAAIRLLERGEETLVQDMRQSLPPFAYILEDAHDPLLDHMEDEGIDDPLEAMVAFLQRPRDNAASRCRWFDTLADGEEEDRELRTAIWKACGGSEATIPAPGVWDAENDDRARRLRNKLDACIRHTARFSRSFRKNRFGYHTLVAAGYHLLEHPTDRAHARGEHPHAFSQPVMGLARLRRVDAACREPGDVPIFWRAAFTEDRQAFLIRAKSLNDL